MPNLARPFVNVHYAISWSSLYWGHRLEIVGKRQIMSDPANLPVENPWWGIKTFAIKKMLQIDIFAIFSLQKSNTILLSAVFWQKI